MSEKKPSILYIDDEENNLVTFNAAFRKHFNIFTATRATDAIDILKKEKIELIITDQRMPEMSGVQFLEAIIPDFPDTIRMLLTGFTDVESIINAINAGKVYRYITKPWNPKELKLIIDNAISYFRLQERNRQLLEELEGEVSKQQHLLKIFEQYVPQSVVEGVLHSEEGTILHGEHRVVAVLFADIRNFTRISAKLEPRLIVEFLNDYFAVMSDCVKKHKGSVNKLLGDGMLIVFGAPISHMHNSYNAIACALEMVSLLPEINAKYKEKLGHEIAIGIGINSGEVVVGNVGSQQHIEYTVIGDVVNVASRIEALTENSPNLILISESTYLSNKERMHVKDHGVHSIKGKDEKLHLYELVALNSP